jgi:hypothetical protein
VTGEAGDISARASKACNKATADRVADTNKYKRFAPSSARTNATPVTLPPGRLRLATRPNLTGSPPLAKTIGIAVVAALAAIAEGVSCAAITVT